MILGVLGLIGSGKGTVGDYLVDHHKFKKDSFASALKDVTSAIFNWPRGLLEGDTKASRDFREEPDEWWGNRFNIQNLTPRWVLQQLGTEVFREHFHKDTWIASLEHRLIQEPNSHRVITDVRFPNEIAMIKHLGGFLVEVRRGENPEWYDYAARYNAQMTTTKDGPDPTQSFGVHESEWAWVGTKVDFLIENNGSLQELQNMIDYSLTLFKGPTKIEHEGEK